MNKPINHYPYIPEPYICIHTTTNVVPYCPTSTYLLLTRAGKIQESLNTSLNIRRQINQRICVVMSAKALPLDSV
jgi:hypothetical protein